MNNDYRDYLEHHGIPGMKWGVRRYQNEDGSLTDKGKKRYAGQKAFELNKADQERAVAAFNAENTKKFVEWKKKAINDLSSKKAKAEAIRDDANSSARKKARQEKRITKLDKRQARINDALNRDLSTIDQNNKRVKEMEKTIDKTIKELSKQKYSIESVDINRYVGEDANYRYYRPGKYYKVKSN